MSYLFNSGWEIHADGQYTSGSPLVLAADTPTTITIDGLGSLTDTSQTVPGLAPVWNTTTNKAELFTPGQVITYRLFFIIKPTGVDKAAIIRVKESGGSINIIEDRIRLAKGAGVAHAVTRSWPIFADAGTVANGLEFSIECNDSADFYAATVMGVFSHLPRFGS